MLNVSYMCIVKIEGAEKSLVENAKWAESDNEQQP